VAVVDGMPETGHEAIAAKLAAPLADAFVFTADRSISSHATNIAGIVAGESAQFIGAAPGIRVLPLIVNLNSQVYAERGAALRFAATCATQRRIGRTRIERLVLSCSWKTAGDLAVIRTALEEAVAAGVVVVCSAGNSGTTAVHFPSAYSNGPTALANGVIAVAATDRDDHLASYSNHSPTVDLCAPGGDGLPIDARDVPCTEQGNAYGFAAGTSISAPHVAAVAALMLSENPELAPGDVKRLLAQSADPIDALNPAYAGTLGSGRLNARRAVAAAGGPGAAETPPAEETLPAETPPAGNGGQPAERGGPRVTISVGGGPRVRISTG
jgi:thermitase